MKFLVAVFCLLYCIPGFAVNEKDNGNLLAGKFPESWELMNKGKHSVKILVVKGEDNSAFLRVECAEKPEGKTDRLALTSRGGKAYVTFPEAVAEYGRFITSINLDNRGDRIVNARIIIIPEGWQKGAMKTTGFTITPGWSEYVLNVPFNTENYSPAGRYFLYLEMDIPCQVDIKNPVVRAFTGKDLFAKDRLSGGKPQRVFHLSFDKGLSAECPGNGKVLNKRKISIADGFSGGALLMENGASVEYPVNKNFNPASGTVNFLFKSSKYEPVNIYDRDLSFNVDIHGKGLFGKDSLLNRFLVTFEQDIIFKGGGRAVCGSRITKLLFPGDWNMYTFTWDWSPEGNKGVLRVYFNGMLMKQGKTRLTFNRFKPERLLIKLDDKIPGDRVLLDEVSVFDKALNGKSVRKLYADYFPVFPVPESYALTAGEKQFLKIRFMNETAGKRFFQCRAVLKKDGKYFLDKNINLTLTPGENIIQNIPVELPERGIYRLNLLAAGKQRTYEIAAATSKPLSSVMPESLNCDLKKKLLYKVDCAKPPPEGVKYCDDGNVGVVKSPSGSFREGVGQSNGSGFGYIFKIKKPEKPHWLKVEYPDDKTRTFIVAVYRKRKGMLRFESMDTVGVITGGHYPNTGKIASKRILFWPDSDEIMVYTCLFSPYSGQAGPALAGIEISELEGQIPKAEINYPEKLPRRYISIWHEDPTMTANCWMSARYFDEDMSFDFWFEKFRRWVTFIRFTGRNMATMICRDYFGSNNGVFKQLNISSHCNDNFVPGWLDLGALIFKREKIPFLLEINQRLGLSDRESSITTIAGEGHFSRNFAEAEKRGSDAVELFNSDNEIVLDMPFRGRKINMNPLHPVIHGAFLKVIRVYAERYADNPFFRGFRIFIPWGLTFTSLKSGYGDYNINTFRRDTGIKIPEMKSPDRFGRRYEWLRKNAWEEWKNWRIEKICGIFRNMAEELNRDNPKEPGKIYFSLQQLHYDTELMKKYKLDREGMYKEFGIDINRLNSIKNVVVMPNLVPNSHRIHNRLPDLRSENFSAELAEIFRANPFPAVSVFQNNNMELYPGKAQVELKNCPYPYGTWGGNNKMVMSFSTTQQPDDYMLDCMNWVLGRFNPFFISNGFWGNPENGNYRAYRKFYQAFLALPAVKFKYAPGVNDPVSVRFYNGIENYLMIVNTQYWPVKLSLEFENVPRFTNVVEKKKVVLGTNSFSRELKPYEIIVWKSKEPIKIKNVVQSVPGNIRNMLAGKVKILKKSLNKPETPEPETPERVKIFEKASRLMKSAKYSELFYFTQNPLAVKMLREGMKEYTFRADFSPGKNVLNLVVKSISKPFTGEIKMKKWPSGWKLKGARRESSGKTTKVEFTFDLNAPLSPDGDYRFVFTVKGKEYEFVCRPYIANYSESPLKIDGCVKDWDNARWYTISSRKNFVRERKDVRKTEGFEHFSAEMAWLWNEKGIALALIVRDKDLIAFREGQKFFEYDSIDIYFDLMNNAVSNSFKKDKDDVGFYIAPHNGKTWSSGFAGKGVEAKVVRRKGRTVYEVFFPAGAFPYPLKEARNIGFSVKVSNRDRVKGTLREYRCVIGTCADNIDSIHAYPGLWRDLILSK